MTLSLTDVTVTVADGPDTLTLLDQVSITVDRGRTLAVTGPSGSGKSTLLAVAGLLRTPNGGRVSIDGTDVTDASTTRRARLRRDQVGIIYQSPNLFPSLTALEQVELVAHIAGRLDKDAKARAAALLDRLGLSHRLESRPAELSGGERQRVNIARALMNDPIVLLADEPTAALDDERGRAVLQLLTDETARLDAATILVTHNLAQLPEDTMMRRLVAGRLEDAQGASV